MSEVKIDKGVPMPGGKGINGTSKYPFRDMEVGDSAFFAGSGPSGAEKNSADMWAKYNKNGCRFASRTVTENGVKGVRIWRTA